MERDGPFGEITVLLRAWSSGDNGALEALMPLVYPLLHRVAAGQMNRERGGHVLQPTALINEAFLRLIDGGQIDWEDRLHFLSISARLMRQVLVDYARRSEAEKRGGKVIQIPIEDANPASDWDFDQVLLVDHAINALAELDTRRAEVVELRFFGGLTIGETADALGLSEESVNRDWRLAKAWLLMHAPVAADGCGYRPDHKPVLGKTLPRLRFKIHSPRRGSVQPRLI